MNKKFVRVAIEGGVLLFFGIDGIKTQRAEKGEKTAKAE